jgi:hypothetical protein
MKISRDIPIPAPRLRGFPFSELSVGDSLAIEKERRDYLLSMAAGYKAKHRASGWNYTTRTVGDETRLWRTA